MAKADRVVVGAGACSVTAKTIGVKMRSLPLVVLLAVLMAFSSSGMASHVSTHHYVAGASPVTIWCEAGGRTYVPHGAPDEHGSAEAWLLSGEPECLAGDLLFGTGSNHGWGGVVEYSYYETISDPEATIDHRGALAVYSFQDDLPGADVPYSATFDIYGEVYYSNEGCGGGFVWQTPMVTDVDHWGRWAMQDMWVYFDTVRVTPQLDVCIGTTGTMSVTYTDLAG